MDFRDFLIWERASRDTIDFKKIYVDMADDLVTGLILSQIIYWFLPKKNGDSRAQVTHDGVAWIAKKNEDWWEECRVKRSAAIRALKRLKELELIDVRLFQFAGAPTVHIRILHDNFMRSWQENMVKLEQDSIYSIPANRFTGTQQIDLLDSSKCSTETTTETTTEKKKTPPAKSNSQKAEIPGEHYPCLDDFKKPEPTPEERLFSTAANRLYDSLAARRKAPDRTMVDLVNWARQLKKYCDDSKQKPKEFVALVNWWCDHAGQDFVVTKGIGSANGFIDRVKDIQECRRRMEADKARQSGNFQDTPEECEQVPLPRFVRRESKMTDFEIRELLKNC